MSDKIQLSNNLYLIKDVNKVSLIFEDKKENKKGNIKFENNKVIVSINNETIMEISL